MRNNAAYLPESPIVYIILPKSIRNRASFTIFALAKAAVAACGKHGAAGAQRNDARSQGPQWATARGRRRRGEGRNDIYKQQHWLLFAFKKKPEKLISEATGN